MSRLLIIFSMLQLSIFSQAGQLPTQISDDFLKVKTVEFLMQSYAKVSPYTITHLFAVRDTSDNVEFAYGGLYIFLPNGDCAVVSVAADSLTCTSVKNCPLQADSYQLPGCELRNSSVLTKMISLAKSRQMKFKSMEYCDARTRVCRTHWVKK